MFSRSALPASFRISWMRCSPQQGSAQTGLPRQSDIQCARFRRINFRQRALRRRSGAGKRNDICSRKNAYGNHGVSLPRYAVMTFCAKRTTRNAWRMFRRKSSLQNLLLRTGWRHCSAGLCCCAGFGFLKRTCLANCSDLWCFPNPTWSMYCSADCCFPNRTWSMHCSAALHFQYRSAGLCSLKNICYLSHSGYFRHCRCFFCFCLYLHCIHRPLGNPA